MPLFRAVSSGLCSGTWTGQKAKTYGQKEFFVFGAQQFVLESFATSIDSWMYLDSSFDDHLNWIAMDKVAPINTPTPSWLTISIHVSCPSALCWHMCLGKGTGLGNLLWLKDNVFSPLEVDLRLLSSLIPYTLWLQKHLCFCRLGNSTVHEMSSSEGEVGEAVSVKSAVLNMLHCNLDVEEEDLWQNVFGLSCMDYPVISFINLHKNLKKKI